MHQTIAPVDAFLCLRGSQPAPPGESLPQSRVGVFRGRA